MRKQFKLLQAYVALFYSRLSDLTRCAYVLALSKLMVEVIVVLALLSVVWKVIRD